MNKPSIIILVVIAIGIIFITILSIMPIISIDTPPKDSDILEYLEKNKNSEIVYYESIYRIGDNMRITKLPIYNRLIFPYYIMDVGPIPRWYKSYKIIKKYDIKSKYDIKTKREVLGL